MQKCIARLDESMAVRKNKARFPRKREPDEPSQPLPTPPALTLVLDDTPEPRSHTPPQNIEVGTHNVFVQYHPQL